jgi:DNA-binding transcriptional regulator YbjK
MAITKRQVRGEERQREVLEATIRLLSREGPHGVTHRAVAREAGTSLRATTYYFASRDELLARALEHYARTALARFDGVAVPDLRDGDDPIALAANLLAGTVLSDLEDDRAGLVAEYEIVLEISRTGALEAPYRAWQGRLEAILAGYAEQLGARDPAMLARIVLSTLRGLELEALSRPSAPPRAEDLTAVFQALLEALAQREGGATVKRPPAKAPAKSAPEKKPARVPPRTRRRDA